MKTIESVNNFNILYKGKRKGVKGGPSTDEQQDLYRAMLVFACAGLDVFVKQLIKNKLPQLIKQDVKGEEEFRKYVEREIKSDDKKTLETVSLALINDKPRDVFLEKYIVSMTESSLQSYDEIIKISKASGLDIPTMFTKQKEQDIKNAFEARNQIIHEMDININQIPSKTRSYRTRQQRTAVKMEKNTKTILNLAEEFFSSYKGQYKKYQIIDIEKKLSPKT